jgi:hypothetical protein
MKKILYFTCFVLLCFLVGLEIGFSRNGAVQAYAKNNQSGIDPVEMYAAEDINITPIGVGAEINSKNSSIYSFTSPSSVKDVISQQERNWQKAGLQTSGKVSSTKGVMLAVKKETREVYQMVAFFCPPSVRSKLCSGQNVFGVLSKLSDEQSDKGNELPFQICNSGKVLSTYSASDLGHPSITGTVLCPATQESVKSDLESEFLNWERRENAENVIVYSKESEEVTVIISGKDEKTLALVTYQRGV